MVVHDQDIQRNLFLPVCSGKLQHFKLGFLWVTCGPQTKRPAGNEPGPARYFSVFFYQGFWIFGKTNQEIQFSPINANFYFFFFNTPITRMAV